ncbi:MAG: hypothetical protein EOM40_06815 [Clostridia bacterium]|nr:hypothetical protein [Clostridia bacterium]NCC42074.1 hypothetical protein [Clostridia bacterium]
MICPNCKHEVTGRFCNFCGAPLEIDTDMPVEVPDYEEFPFGSDSMDTIHSNDNNRYTNAKSAASDNDLSARKKASSGSRPSTVNQKNTIKQKTKVKTKKKKSRGNILSSIGSATFKGTKGIWKTILLASQWICCALMVFSVYLLAVGFWGQRTTLGSMAKVIQERNLAQGIYLIGALCILAFGALQAFWMVSRKKMPDHGKVRRIDMGRGLFGFAVFLLLYAAAVYVNPLIPASPSLLVGIKQLLSVIAGRGSFFLLINLAGILLCIFRKVGTR